MCCRQPHTDAEMIIPPRVTAVPNKTTRNAYGARVEVVLPCSGSRSLGRWLESLVRISGLHRACRTVDLAGRAVPAFVILHESDAGLLIDRQDVERADVHTDGAAFVRDALHARIEDRHRSRESVAFLKQLDDAYPAQTAIKLILDNHSAHISKETRAWLAAQPTGRFCFVFTPKHGSWLNLVEGFFSKITRSMLRNIRVGSKAELKTRIMAYLDDLNRDPVVHSWTYKISNATRLESILGNAVLYPDSPSIRRSPLAKRREPDSTDRMIRRGFLDSESRQDLIELARDGSAAHRLARRANALVLLDDGMSCEAIARVLLIDDDTIRTWFRLYQEDGIEGLASFGYEGGACRLTGEQQDKLKAWISETLPRTTREIGAWIERECGIAYQGRSGLIALLHRLGMEHRKPKAVSRKLDPEKQAAFIKAYEDLLNHLADDEAVLFADAVHPTHAVRPVGCWAPKDTKIAVSQTSGRQRLNIHGAIDLETGQTRMLDVLTVDAASTIMLLMAIEAMYPGKRLIHLFVDNARYHHAKLVQAWLARPGCRIRLHFIPAYCPHLDPIERLWGLAHKHITHNRCHEKFADFSDAFLTFLREEVPRNWHLYCDAVSDNFRVISPKDFRIMA